MPADTPLEHVFDTNITHNLGKMAEAALIYKECWRPEELGITRAEDLIQPLTNGLKRLKFDPEYFKQFNAPNGWGLYEHFVPWVEELLEACKKWPDSVVEASR